jgi:hypothetical protein
MLWGQKLCFYSRYNIGNLTWIGHEMEHVIRRKTQPIIFKFVLLPYEPKHVRGIILLCVE